MLLHATRVMTAASGLLTSLPFDTVEDLENAQFEERERVLDAIADLQELAYEFAAWHLEFRKQAFKWDTYGSRNPLCDATAGPAASPRHTGPTRRCSPERSRGRPHSSRFRHRRHRRCSSAPTPAARSRSSLNGRP